MSTTFSDIDVIDVNEGDLSQILETTEDLFHLGSLSELENQILNQPVYNHCDYNIVKQEETPDGNEAPGGNNVAQPFIISNEEYPGTYQFNVFIDPHHGTKSPWVYSAPLKKVFILMNQVFPVDFKWVGCENKDLFVRATPIFSVQHQHEMVTRCIPHAHRDDKSNIGHEPHVWDHIIRCRNPNAVYMGSKESNTHLSVVVPMGRPQAGADTVRHLYEFVCKNSCQTGMNRRQLEVIFTLEDIKGEVLGRKALNIRVCSCPKRDKDKEEREYGRTVKDEPPPQSKKRKLEKKPPSFTGTSVDTKEYEISFKMIGKQNVQAVYKFAANLLAGDMIRRNAEQPYKKCMQEIEQLAQSSGSLSS